MRNIFSLQVLICILFASTAALAPSRVPPVAPLAHPALTSMRAGGHPSVACSAPAHRPNQSPLLCSVLITGTTALTLDERTGRVFVAREDGDVGYVSMFDARNGALLRTVAVGIFPLAIAVDETTGHVFVTNQGEPNIKGSRSVSMLDARTGVVLRTTPVRGDPVNLVVAERAGRVFTIDANDSNVNVLDARTGSVVASDSLTHGPFSALAVAEREQRVFITGMFMQGVVMLNARTGKVLRTVQGAAGPMAVDERRGHVYTGSTRVLDARSGMLLRLHLLRGAMTLAVDEKTRRVIASTGVTVDVSDADSGALQRSTNVDTQPAAAPVLIDHTGHMVVLLNSATDDNGNILGPGYLLVFDGHSGALLRRVTVSSVSSGPLGPSNLMAIDNRTNRLFVLEGRGLDMFDAARL